MDLSKITVKKNKIKKIKRQVDQWMGGGQMTTAHAEQQSNTTQHARSIDL